MPSRNAEAEVGYSLISRTAVVSAAGLWRRMLAISGCPGLLQYPHQIERDSNQISRAVDARMLGRSVGQGEVLARAQYSVTEYKRGSAHGVEFGFDQYQLVIACGSGVVAVRIDDGKVNTASFDLSVGHAQLTQEFTPAALKPAQVVGVVDDAHLIRVAINNPIGSQIRVGNARGGRFWDRPDVSLPFLSHVLGLSGYHLGHADFDGKLNTERQVGPVQ